MVKKSVKNLLRVWGSKAGLAVLLCAAILAACSGGDDDVIPKTVVGTDLTDLIPLPQAGSSRPQTIEEQAQFTGAVKWEYIFEGGSFVSAQGPGFLPDVTYRAVLTLTAKPGYTFEGLAENSFTHRKGVAVNPAGTGSSLDVTIEFPKTPKEGDQLVSETNLGAVVSAPYQGGTPQTTASLDQYDAAISWETADGEALDGTFAPSTVYRAVIVLSPKDGYTLSGLDAGDFTHPNTDNISFDPSHNTVYIVFDSTKAEGEAEPVTLYDISGLIPPPVHRQTPVWTIENDQYTGTLAWSEGETPIGEGGTYDCEKPFQALLTLSAKEGFTLEGLPADAFTHTGSVSISNAADSGIVTIAFAAVPWLPGAVAYPSLVPQNGVPAIKICCYPGSGNSGIRLLNNSTLTNGSNQNGFWDYGWNGNASQNSSDWADVLKDIEGVDFTGDECGQGHPTVFLTASVPEAIRKRAHCFTLDLGEVTSGIVSFGMYPRTNESESERGDRWPVQFEVFYSDTEIGAIPGEEAASLGVFEWGPAPYPFAWRDIDLYPRTDDNRSFSARYIHVRIYAEGKNGPNANWVCPSFAGIRIGVDSGTDQGDA
jgi:hypothetical protein